MSTLNFSHLRLLAVFATVVETGSFAAAARHLGSSRSRISEQVSQLEASLGVRLLQRSTRQLLLTPEGRQVHERAGTLPGLLGDVESAVTATEPQGRVALTMNHDYAHIYVLPLLEEFQSIYPLIDLDLILDDEKTDLISQQIDVGIRIGLPKDSSLVGRMLYEECLSVFASPRYLENAGTPKSVKEMGKCRWILLPQFSPNDVLRMRNRNRPAEIRPSSFYRCNSPFMMQKMVVAGVGIGALLPSMVKKEINNGLLVPLIPSLKTEPLVISIVYPSRHQVPQRTRVLIDFLQAKAADANN